MSAWSATILERDYEQLRRHLFQSDRDEHAAFLYAGLVEADDLRRFLIREVHPVPASEFTSSDRGAYRQIVPRAVARAALRCDELGLCLLWAHSHPLAGHRVDFSPDDLAAHRYAHPALIDLTHGRPVAGLVFGGSSAAGEVWASGATPQRLDSLRVIGRSLRTLRPRPPATSSAAERFARQVLMFGSEGQQILRGLTVAVVGAGGGGSLLVEMLAHLGVGQLIILDYDLVSESNLSRIVGATSADIGRLKVDVAREHVARIDADIHVDAVEGDIAWLEDARRLRNADFAFLATDNILSRHAFNLVCHQYLIPGIQVGAKVTGDATGGIELIHIMERPLTLEGPCLDCQGAIPADVLAQEQQSPAERAAQAYVDGARADEIEEPSVITLNAVATSLAATDFLLMATGLTPEAAGSESLVYYPQLRELRTRAAARRSSCRVCGSQQGSVMALGDLRPLSLRQGSRPKIVTGSPDTERGRGVLRQLKWHLTRAR